jgi:GNAT superfamily N-acetyltransferase
MTGGTAAPTVVAVPTPNDDLDIRAIDLGDESDLRSWWEVGRAATAERPGKPWPLWEQSRRALPAHNPERGIVLLGAVHDGEMVGSGMLTRPLRDNLHTAMAFAFVVPGRTRRGIGSAVLAELEALAVADGRTTVQSEAYVPPGGTAAAEGFAAATGYAVASRDSIKELALDDYAERRPGLPSGPGGYRIVTFDTVCPEEHVESFGRLLGMLMDEIPLGELDLESSEWTPERVRAAEHRQVETGRHVHTAIAIAPDGEVAGVSDVRVDEADREHAQVGITLVHPQHRGQRLGLALKVATHDLVRAAYPSLRTVDTSNAEVNTHMNAVNETLGYRSIETLLELQKRL